MPTLNSRVAKIATTMAGVIATTLNSSTRRTCSRAPAEPRRRSAQTRVSRPASTAPSSSSTTRLASTSANTAFGRTAKCTPPASRVKVATPSVTATAASTSVTALPSRMSASLRPRGAGSRVAGGRRRGCGSAFIAEL